MVWKCPECGTIRLDGPLAKCICGYKLEGPLLDLSKMMLCPGCSHHARIDQDFCDKCGFNLKLCRSNPDSDIRSLYAPNSVATEPSQKQDTDISNLSHASNTGISEPQRVLTLEFNGSAREYFRIWIVNLCLSLLTLGIFSAWAKVRKKRYFYSHTIIDGTPFQYLGRPVPILKGRIIAAVAFSAYYVSSHFFTSFLPYVLTAGAVLAPWVIIRSAAFNARYSSFRNMTFRFDGRYRDAVKELYAWVLIPVVFVAVFSTGLNMYAIAAAVGIALAIGSLLFPWWIKRFKGFIIGHTSFGNRKGAFSATGGQFFKIYFSAGLVLIGIVMIVGILVASTSSFIDMSPVQYLLGSIPIYAGYVFAYAYVKARGGNLVWNQTRLGPVSFRSTLPAMGMVRLYLTNALAIIASVGMLTPWAVMRTLKYRADNLHVLLEGRLTDFQGSETAGVQAIGAELGDLFDVDLSL